MVSDTDLIILMVAYVTCALMSAGILFWMRYPIKVSEFGCRTSKLILSLLSYPLAVISIILTHMFLCVLAIANYTVARVGGRFPKSIKVKTTFDY